MITIAKMIREDKNVSRDDSFVQEEMAKVMEFETEIANVSRVIKNSSGRCGGQGVRGRGTCWFVLRFSMQQKTHGTEKVGEEEFLCQEPAQKSEPLCL